MKLHSPRQSPQHNGESRRANLNKLNSTQFEESPQLDGGFFHQLTQTGRSFSFKALIRESTEVFFSVGMVLVFFLILLGLLNNFFPSGPNLRELMALKGSNSQKGSESYGPKALIPFGEKETRLSASQEFRAVLTKTRNEIKSKRATSIAWEPARQGMTLYHRDAIQTFEKARATIQLDEGKFLDMGENSLVILQRLEKDLFLNKKRSFVVVIDGELRGRISGSDQEEMHIEITTPGGIARIESQDSGKSSTDFKITVNPDKSSTLSVYQGVVILKGKDRTVRVGENQSSILRLNEGPTLPKRLPDPPQLISPEKEQVLYYRELPPQIQFAWNPPPGFDQFHFVLDESPTFQNPLVDERLTQPHFTHGNLKGNQYYWRVSVVDEGREGAFSQVETVRVVQDLEPPLLQVEFPSGSLKKTHFMLKGKTEPGASVFIGGKKVPTTRTGEFNSIVELQDGVNVIVVEAVDPAGNVTYRSRFVNATF